MSDSRQHGEQARNDQDDHAEVADVVARYEAAFNGNDANAMNALFHRRHDLRERRGQPRIRVRVLVPGAGVRLRRATARGLRQVHHREHHLPATRVAVAHARQRPATADGTLKSVDAENKESIVMFVLSRTATGWQIRVGQNTMVA